MLEDILEDRTISDFFKLKPRLELPEYKVAQVNRINTDDFDYEALGDLYKKLVSFFKSIPVGQYKQITINTKGFLHYPRTKNQEKNQFIEKMERYVNANWDIRERKSYLLYQPHIDEQVLYGNAELLKGMIKKTNPKIFQKDLSYIFQGTEEYPFGATIKRWQYGFKINNKYAIGLINFGVGGDIIKFAMDFLNGINDDFISILHFENMDKLQVEKTISTAISVAEKTRMPGQVISELQHLKNENFARGVPLMQFFHIIYIFGNSPQECIKKAYNIKARAPYLYAFEGNMEFEAILSLTNWNYLKGKDMTGAIRRSTIDYFASMFYCTSRYTGKPEGLWIPLLNETKEPAYVPIDLSLFNVATQGQMGSGKSVSIQYLATMFDNAIFIEKIQSDVGSYAVYCNYFNGDHIPISLEVPVSINPLGKASSYFSINIFDLARTLGIQEPHKFFDENERQAITFVIDDKYFDNPKEHLSKQELLEILEQEPRSIRLRKQIELMPDDFYWKPTINTNPVKKVFVNTVISFMFKGEDAGIANFGEVKSEIEKYVDAFYMAKYEEDPKQDVFLHQFYDFIDIKMPDSGIKRRLMSRLYTFIRDGKFGHLFDRPTSIKKDVDHIFFEVRFNETEIIPIVIMTIMDYINTTFGTVYYRDKAKLVVIDEGWFFMNIDMARSFIDEAFRTYRKRGIGIAFATQNPEDFAGMTNYFPYVWILYLEDPTSAVNIYRLGKREYSLLKEIEKPKAYRYKYAKIFLRFKNEYGSTEQGMFILPSYPEFRWIAETDPIFKLEREEAVMKMGNWHKAIEYLAFYKDKEQKK